MCEVPGKILQALLAAQKQQGETLYAVGGSVRDLLLKRVTNDLDLVVPNQPEKWAKRLVVELGGGTVVSLSEELGQETIRVVWKGEQIDFASYRKGADSLEGDLRLRDFSMNAMALPVAQYCDQRVEKLVDPCCGMEDIQQRQIRHLPGAFTADPLRMLRGYRFAATLRFTLADESREAVKKLAASLLQVAEERRSYEMRQIFLSDCTAQVVVQMAEDGLLRYLLPELYQAERVSQPSEFHHLPVLEHCFLALSMMEDIVRVPENFFSDPTLLVAIKGYLAEKDVIYFLKWAALLHDIGKPATKKECLQRGRTTFYNHDQVGKKLFEAFARRSRWSDADTRRIARLIDMHMRPFHLVTLQQKDRVSKKAALRFSKQVGRDFLGLFLLALSDCLAGNPKHQKRMKDELMTLFVFLEKVYRDDLLPVMQSTPLLDGRDLIALGFTPGPVFSEILTSLEEAQVEGLVVDRQTAISWVKKFYQQDLLNKNKVTVTCVK